MDIISRAQWGAKAPTNSLTTMRYPEGWVVHYVGVNGMNHSPSYDQSCATMRSIQDYAQHHGYSDFEYNFAVDPCGRVFEGRGWDYGNAANGTTSSNNHTWAVVYLGGEDMPLYPAARDALFALTQAGAQRWGGVSYVKPHRSVAPIGTSCPGNETAAFCDDLQTHLHDTTVAPAAQPPKKKWTPVLVTAPFNAPINDNIGGVSDQDDGSLVVLGTVNIAKLDGSLVPITQFGGVRVIPRDEAHWPSSDWTYRGMEAVGPVASGGHAGFRQCYQNKNSALHYREFKFTS